MAKFRDKTIFVRARARARMHLLDLGNEVTTRDHFAKRLGACGLKVDRASTDWHTLGDLTPTEGAG